MSLNAGAALDGSSKRPTRYLLYAPHVFSLEVLRPLQAAIRREGGEVAWFVDGPEGESLRRDEVRLDGLEQLFRFDPFAVFVPCDTVPDFFPGIKVSVFSGLSLDPGPAARARYRPRGFIDLYCTHGGTTTPRFKALAERCGHFHAEETGWPKLDPMFAPSGEASNPWASGWECDRPILLYAASRWPALSSARALHDTIRSLAAAGRWNWLVTLHPASPRETVQAYEGIQGPYLRVVRTDDVLPLLRAAEVMVGDTSSLVLEFLMLHKPVVTLRNAQPGPHLVDIGAPGDLAGAVETALARPRRLMRHIADFAWSVHAYRDGCSSERVLAATREFYRMYRARLRRKPLNLWRRIEMRRQHGYYHWR